MAYIVNSSPGAGLRFEDSKTFPEVKAAHDWAIALERRGMRLVRIVDTATGLVFNEKELRAEIKRLQEAS